MGLKVVTDSVGVINLLFTVIVVVAFGFAAWGLIKKSTLEVLKTSNDALEKSNTQLAGRMTTLEDSFHTQEKRLFRVEIDNERKGRLLNTAREEIRILEMAVQVAVPCLSTQTNHKTEYDRIVKMLGELTESRRQSALQQEEWEATQTSTLTYIESRIDATMARGKDSK